MKVLLLPIAWFLIFINCYMANKKKQLNYSFGELILIAAIAWMLILVFLTEFLSLFHQLNQFWIAGSWSTILILLTICFLRGNYSLDPLLRGDDTKKLKGLFNWFFDLDWFYRLLAIGTLLIIGTTLILGLIFPPNGADALSYHLPRVMHWLQNQSVAFYPTHIVRQDIIQPGAEYIALHILALSNYNSFVHLIQWFSMVGSLITVCLITALLGGTKKAQILAVAFAITLPIGILESNSAQNDWVATFWLLTFIYFLLKGFRSERRPYILLSAVALGLAILTKVTNYFYGFSFLLLFLWPNEKKRMEENDY